MNTEKIITTIDLLKEACLLKVNEVGAERVAYSYEIEYENFFINFEQISEGAKSQLVYKVKVSEIDKKELFTVKVLQENSSHHKTRSSIYIDGQYIENKEDQIKLLEAVPLNELMEVLNSQSNKIIKQREDTIAPEIKSDQLVTQTLSRIEALRFKLDKNQLKPT